MLIGIRAAQYQYFPINSISIILFVFLSIPHQYQLFSRGLINIIINTRVFFISITDFAWASQCLIFRPFEPQKMLIQCLKFALTNNKFWLQTGKIVNFWQHGEYIWIHYSLNLPNFNQIYVKKDCLMPNFDFGQPRQMLIKCLNFRDFEAWCL